MLRNYLFCVLTIILIFMYSGKADIRKDCRKESKVSWAALKAFKSGDLTTDDSKLKCYFLCFMKKNGILDKNADVDVEKALRHLPVSLQDSSIKLFDTCKYVNETDQCDKAYQMVKCYVKARPEILKNVPFL